MVDARSDANAPVVPLAWFEQIGASGFAGMGAAIGLAFSLLLVWAAAPESPAAPGEPRAPSAVQARPATVAPAPPGPTPQTSPAPPEVLTQHPIPAEPPVAVATAPSPVSPPQAALSVLTPAVPSASSGPTVVVADQATSEPPARPSTTICGYLTVSGEPCRNPVSGGGYCYLHRAKGPMPSSTGSTGGTAHVRGYYRKDGTYVRPHTRSAPRRR
jgi:hypothetical protein